MKIGSKFVGEFFSGGVYILGISGTMMTCELCKIKNECKDGCKHKSPGKLYSFVNEKGEESCKSKKGQCKCKIAG